MEHNIIDVLASPGIQKMVLLKKDNNLDHLDNLGEIPDMPAVYAICGRVNGAPANPRAVNAAMNLRQAVVDHFSTTEEDECVRTFMQSIKIKELVYEILPDASAAVLEEKRNKWVEKFRPSCNEVLNKVY